MKVFGKKVSARVENYSSKNAGTFCPLFLRASILRGPTRCCRVAEACEDCGVVFENWWGRVVGFSPYLGGRPPQTGLLFVAVIWAPWVLGGGVRGDLGVFPPLFKKFFCKIVPWTVNSWV